MLLDGIVEAAVGTLYGEMEQDGVGTMALDIQTLKEQPTDDFSESENEDIVQLTANSEVEKGMQVPKELQNANQKESQAPANEVSEVAESTTQEQKKPCGSKTGIYRVVFDVEECASGQGETEPIVVPPPLEEETLTSEEKERCWNKRERREKKRIEGLTAEELEELRRKLGVTALPNRREYTGTRTSQSVPSQRETMLQFDCRFEGGNLRKVYQISDTEYALIINNDYGTNQYAQWFYFLVRNIHKGKYLPDCADSVVRFNVLNLAKSESLYNEGMRPCFCSLGKLKAENTGWHRSGSNVVYKKNAEASHKLAAIVQQLRVSNCSTLSFTYHFEYENDCVYIAHCYPYSHSRLYKYLHNLKKEHASQDVLEVATLCYTLACNSCYLCIVTEGVRSYISCSAKTSVLGKKQEKLIKAQDHIKAGKKGIANRNKEVSQYEANTIVDAAIDTKLGIYQHTQANQHKDKQAVVISGRIHPGETNSSYVGEGLLDFLTSQDPRATELRKRYVFYVLPMLNPDGVIYGNYRCSLLGVDLNRQWINPSRALHPTIYHAKELMRELAAERTVASYCDFHGHSAKKHVLMLGCQYGVSDPSYQEKNRRIRLLPYLMAKLNRCFSVFSSQFTVEKHKASTGRAVMFNEFGIVLSYTLETSFYGSEGVLLDTQLSKPGGGHGPGAIHTSNALNGQVIQPDRKQILRSATLDPIFDRPKKDCAFSTSDYRRIGRDVGIAYLLLEKAITLRKKEGQGLLERGRLEDLVRPYKGDPQLLPKPNPTAHKLPRESSGRRTQLPSNYTRLCGGCQRFEATSYSRASVPKDYTKGDNKVEHKEDPNELPIKDGDTVSAFGELKSIKGAKEKGTLKDKTETKGKNDSQAGSESNQVQQTKESTQVTNSKGSKLTAMHTVSRAKPVAVRKMTAQTGKERWDDSRNIRPTHDSTHKLNRHNKPQDSLLVRLLTAIEAKHGQQSAKKDLHLRPFLPEQPPFWQYAGLPTVNTSIPSALMATHYKSSDTIEAPRLRSEATRRNKGSGKPNIAVEGRMPYFVRLPLSQCIESHNPETPNLSFKGYSIKQPTSHQLRKVYYAHQHWEKSHSRTFYNPPGLRERTLGQYQRLAVDGNIHPQLGPGKLTRSHDNSRRPQQSAPTPPRLCDVRGGIKSRLSDKGPRKYITANNKSYEDLRAEYSNWDHTLAKQHVPRGLTFLGESARKAHRGSTRLHKYEGAVDYS